jgi:hypothetical protein
MVRFEGNPHFARNDSSEVKYQGSMTMNALPNMSLRGYTTRNLCFLCPGNTPKQQNPPKCLLLALSMTIITYP